MEKYYMQLKKIEAKYYMPKEKNPFQSPVLYKINSVKSIKRDLNSSLIERIIFGRGEIELRITGRELEICSKNKNGEVTYKISKTLAYDITPEEAITNSEKSIFYRLFSLEMNRRETETKKGLDNYLSTYDIFPDKKRLLFEKFRRAKNSGDLPAETIGKIMEAFDAREKEKISA